MAQAAQDTSMPGGMPIPLPPPRPADLTPAVPRPAPLGNPVAPYAQAFGGGLGVMPNAVFFNPGAASQAPANVPLPPDRPASVVPGGMGMPFQPRGAPIAAAPTPAAAASMFGPASVAASNEANQNFAQGDTPAGIGASIRAGVLGAGHVAASPFVSAAAGAGQVATFAQHLSHGLFGTTPAAAVPQQVAAGGAAPGTAPGAAPGPISFGGLTAAPAHVPTAISFGGPTAGAPGLVSFGGRAPGTVSFNTPEPPRLLSNGMPMPDDIPKGFPKYLADKLPGNPALRIAAIQGYQTNLAAAQNEKLKSTVLGNIEASLAEAMKPVANESLEQTALRIQKARADHDMQQLLLQNSNAAQAGYLMGYNRPAQN